MLRTTNVRDGYVDTANCRFVTREVYEKWTRRQVPRRGDVILTREAPLGEVGMLRDDETVFLGQRLMSYRADPSKLDANFLLYSLMGPELQAQIRAAGSGSTVEHMRVPDAERLKIRLPDLLTQQRIGTILASYDELYLNNQRRIAILEDVARRLFDEWFVRFRYPGHEAVPFTATELGPMPDRWRPGTVADLSSFISRGLAPKYDDEASSLVINQKCIRDQALNLSSARTQSKPIPQSKLVIDGDILINSTGVGTLGRVAQLLGTLPNATVDTHVTIVRAADQVDLHYFGLQLLQLQPHLERQGIGATGQTELSRTAIADTKLVVPPSDLANKFGRIAGPLRHQAELLRNQNIKLRTARDLLLPKLISGEIDVSAREETFAEAAE
ncbi:restriction endonuclease subunit S [Ensifer adhaerens]|uniref:restriction endonuclease subunit S n=1 Tax=Ensifer adhaerens TaxID=106592 RepID=UPI001F1E1652|nr:restriction endonuclease subunit S [Ensifer adhaerens]